MPTLPGKYSFTDWAAILSPTGPLLLHRLGFARAAETRPGRHSVSGRGAGRAAAVAPEGAGLMRCGRGLGLGFTVTALPEGEGEEGKEGGKEGGEGGAASTREGGIYR